MIDKNVKYSLDDVCIMPAKNSFISHRSMADIWHKTAIPHFEDGKTLPLFTAPMDSVVSLDSLEFWEKNKIIPIVPRTVSIEERIESVRQQRWTAFGLSEFNDLFCNLGSVERSILVKGVEDYYVLIDIANGNMERLMNSIKSAVNASVHNNGNPYHLHIMAGNIANPETYGLLSECGVEYVRCSIGTGNVCLTSSNTGVHYPMASLLDEINEIKKKRESWDLKCAKVIADGGIRNYSDIIKSLALGADYVMVGTLFGSFFESPSELIYEFGSSHYIPLFMPLEKFYSNWHTSIKDDQLQKYVNSLTPESLNNKIVLESVFSGEKQLYNYVMKFYKKKDSENNSNYNSIVENMQSIFILDKVWLQNHEDVKRKIIELADKSLLYKKIRGMSTKEAQLAIGSSKESLKTSEGKTKLVEVKYTAKQWTENFEHYLKSAMSYCNAKSLDDFIGEQELLIMSPTAKNAINK